MQQALDLAGREKAVRAFAVVGQQQLVDPKRQLGRGRRTTQDQSSARLEHARRAPAKSQRIGHMLERLQGKDKVELVIGKRKREQIGLDKNLFGIALAGLVDQARGDLGIDQIHVRGARRLK